MVTATRTLTVTPHDINSSWAQGYLYKVTPKDISYILGFNCNIKDDPDKVKYSWAFLAEDEDGVYECAIWDWKGSSEIGKFSTYGPPHVFHMLFGAKTKDLHVPAVF